MEPEPSTAELLGCICFRLRKATRKITQIYDRALEPSGLTIAQFALLAHLPRGRQVPLAQLADELGTDPSTLTRNIRLLEKGGLVQLIDAPFDKRVRLALSAGAGRAALKRAAAAWRAARSELEARTDEALLDELDGVLSPLLERL